MKPENTFEAATVNPSPEYATFKFAFDDKFIDKLIGRMDQNREIFEKVLEDTVFGDLVKQLMMKKVHERMNGA